MANTSSTVLTSTLAAITTIATPSATPQVTTSSPQMTTVASSRTLTFVTQTFEVTPLMWGTTCCIIFGVMWFIGFAVVLAIYWKSYNEMVARRSRRQATLASLFASSPESSPTNAGGTFLGGFGNVAGSGGLSPYSHSGGNSPIILDDRAASSNLVDFTTITFNESLEPYSGRDVSSSLRKQHHAEGTPSRVIDDGSMLQSSPQQQRGKRSGSLNSDVTLLDQHRQELEATLKTTTRSGVSHAVLFGSAPTLPPPPLRRESSSAIRYADRDRMTSRNYFDDTDHLIPPPPPRPMRSLADQEEDEELRRRPSLRLDGRVFGSGDGGVTIRGIHRVDL